MILINLDPGPCTLTQAEREARARIVAEEFRIGTRTIAAALALSVLFLAVHRAWPWGFA